MEEALFWSLLGFGSSFLGVGAIKGWLSRVSGSGKSRDSHGFAQGSNPAYLKPEDQDWISPWPLRPSFWVRLGVILLAAASIVSAVAKLIEAINNLID